MIELKGGYNRYNFLLKVKAVNEIYLEYSKKGVSSGYIYKTYIQHQFFISRATFYAYLQIPYKKEIEREKAALAERERKKELKRLEEERIRQMQLNIFENK